MPFLSLTMSFLSKRRHATGLIFGVVSVVVLGMVLILGALVYFAFGNAIPTGLVTGAQVSTLNSIINTGASALSLLEVLLIVAAAGLIIAGVFTYMAFGRRSPMAIAALHGDFQTAFRLAFAELQK